MFPWLAHGHIFPFPELAKRILKKKNFHIYLCSTTIHFTSINSFIHANSLQNSIELIQLHLEPNPQLPPHLHTTKNLPSNLIFDLLKAFQTSKSSFSDILSNLKPNLVVYHGFQPWAAELVSSLSIPAVNFVITGEATSSFVHHNYVSWNDDFPFPELCLGENEKRSFDNLIQFVYANIFDFDKDVFFVNYRLSAEVVLLKTSRGLEGKYVDYVSSVSQKRILAVGPLVGDDQDHSSDILEWLSKNPKNSTVYFCFGSEC
ncbi:hypothetical protein C2S52_007606 [Perilla frutescens var. hirtella]|nr:hypothetical protein C2S52_007606 [Perilla frutescens var. hirtella]